MYKNTSKNNPLSLSNLCVIDFARYKLGFVNLSAFKNTKVINHFFWNAVSKEILNTKSLQHFDTIPSLQEQIIDWMIFFKNFPITPHHIKSQNTVSILTTIINALKEGSIYFENNYLYMHRYSKNPSINCSCHKNAESIMFAHNKNFFNKVATIRYQCMSGDTLASYIYTFPFKNLKQLFIINSNVKIIAPTIGSLVYLKTLILKNNKLEDLPESMCNLRNLTHLHIQNNNFKQIPVSITQLSNLKSLRAFHNYIKEIPNISNLTNLEVLDLEDNEIIKVHSSLNRLPNIMCIYLTNNPLVKSCIPISCLSKNNHNIEEKDLSTRTKNALVMRTDQFYKYNTFNKREKVTNHAIILKHFHLSVIDAMKTK